MYINVQCKQQEILVFLTTVVDICGIDFCRRALKSHQNVIHSPMKIDTVPLISSFQLSYRSLPLVNFQSENNIDPLCNWDLKSWIIRKTILSNKIHGLRIKKCPETGSKSKNLIKLHGPHSQKRCVYESHVCVVSGSYFELMLINERTHNNRQRNYFSKNFYSKAHKLILKSNSRNPNLARGSAHASKIGCQSTWQKLFNTNLKSGRSSRSQNIFNV